jgi:hypothetical protein
LLFLISWVGAGWAIKAQYIIMAFLALSIVAFLGGAAANFQLDLIKKNWLPVYALRIPMISAGDSDGRRPAVPRQGGRF